MILEKLRLENFRCFVQPVEIAFDERITVISGANGLGKTTLRLGLERGIFDRHDCRDEAIKRLAPWKTDLSPRVAIEFKVGGKRYRLEKTFGSRADSRLSAERDGAFIAWKEGAAATDWVREVLGGRLPGRGATKAEHRGLAQVLFVPQGGVRLPERLGEGAAERLRAVVGTVTVDATTRAVEEEVAKLYAAIFTPVRGERRDSSPAAKLEDAAAIKRQEVEATRHEWLALDDLAFELDTARDAVAALETKKVELSRDKERLKPLVATYRGLQTRRDDASRRRDDAKRAFDDLATRAHRIADLRGRVAKLGESVALLAAEEVRIAGELEHGRAELGAALDARAAHEKTRTRVDDARRMADEAGRFTAAIASAAELAQRRARWASFQTDVLALERDLASSEAPSRPKVKQLRDAIADERSAREALEALKLRLEVTALEAVAIEVGGRKIRLGKSKSHVSSGDGALELVVGDVAKISVSGPTTDIVRARASHTERLHELDALAEELGTRDPEELEAKRARHKELDSKLKVAIAGRDSTLDDGDTVEKLDARIDSLRAKVAKALAANPSWTATPPDSEALAGVHAEVASEFKLELERLQSRENAARENETATTAALAEAQTRHNGERTKLETARGELKAVEADGLTDAALEAKRREASLDFQKSEDAVALAENALDEFPEDPGVELERVERALADTLERLPAKERERGSRERALADATRRAPYSRLADLESELAVLEAKLARAVVDEDAVRLLQDTFRAERAAVTKKLFAPVVSRVLPRLRRLAGPAFEGLELDSDFKPTAVRLRDDVTAEPEDLSHGTLDQLSVLVRLALGELVSEGEPVPAVLDDPLVHTDPARLRRFLGVLEEASNRLQLVVLTCRPDDYAALAHGAHVDLAAASRPAVAALAS